jgi:hypothetical protein
MIAGVGAALCLMLTHHDPLFGLSAGFLALCLNFSVVVGLSLVIPDVAEEAQPQRTASELRPAIK